MCMSVYICRGGGLKLNMRGLYQECSPPQSYPYHPFHTFLLKSMAFSPSPSLQFKGS